MKTFDRRDFLKTSAAAGAAGLMSAWPATPPRNGMRLGLIIGMGKDPEAALQKVHDLGIPTCQVSTENFSDAMLEGIRAAVRKFNLEVTALNTSGPGPQVYDFYQGPLTIGLVPRQYRAQRIAHLKQASDFAKKLGIPALHTHFGFIPENPNDAAYKDVVPALREVATYLKGNEQMMLYETGQETPITLLRAITDVGLENQFINLDTANLILYGKGNPLDALDVIGELVRGAHAKDGLFPTDPKKLGEEVPIGQGKVDFPQLVARLKKLGYDGPLTIEREISGPRQLEDIRKEKQYLEKLIA
jgi:sugar phosphate isomerase/epimerase